MARLYVQSIIAYVQRVALALYPSRFSSDVGLRLPPVPPEAHTLACWICLSYRCFLGVELIKPVNEGSELILKTLWHHSDAVMCCSLKDVIKVSLDSSRIPIVQLAEGLLISDDPLCEIDGVPIGPEYCKCLS